MLTSDQSSRVSFKRRLIDSHSASLAKSPHNARKWLNFCVFSHAATILPPGHLNAATRPKTASHKRTCKIKGRAISTTAVNPI